MDFLSRISFGYLGQRKPAGPYAGPGLLRRLAAHFRLWWRVHLVISALVTVIAVPVLLMVVVPKVAQAKLDAAGLEMLSVRALDTAPSKMALGIASIIRSDGSVRATVDGFDGVMYLEDVVPHRPFVTVRFPETTSAASQEVNITQVVPVTDVDAFQTFNTWVWTNETVHVTVLGDTHVHVWGIPISYPVTFKKTVAVKGLTKLGGTEDRSNTRVAIAERTSAPGPRKVVGGRRANFTRTVMIPNRSIFTIEVGNITFNAYVNGRLVGEVFINDMVLRPGNHTYRYRAELDQAMMFTEARKRPACETGELPFELGCTDVVNKGERIEYLRGALATANVTTTVHIRELVKSIYNITLSCPK